MKFLIAFLLKFINPHKPLGEKLFNAIAKVVVTPTLEAVSFKGNGEEIEVFLTQRSKSDASYPGLWHVPGTVIRPLETFKDSLNRMAKSECGVEVSSFEIIGFVNNPHEPRGHFVSPVTLVKFNKEPKGGSWVKVSLLDNSVIDFHKNLVIPMALDYYKKQDKTAVKFVENL